MNANFNPNGNLNVNSNLKPENRNDNLGARFSSIASCFKNKAPLKDEALFIEAIFSIHRAFFLFHAEIPQGVCISSNLKLLIHMLVELIF